MSRRLLVTHHLPDLEVLRLFRQCSDVTERERLHCVLLKMRGRTTKEVAAFFVRNDDWVRRTVRRYNALGSDGLKDLRRDNGRARRVTREDEIALEAVLQSLPPDGGLWSGPKVAIWLSERKGVPCSKHLGWKTLQRLGYSLQRPRPKQPEADEQAQDAFKKGDSRLRSWVSPRPTRTP